MPLFDYLFRPKGISEIVWTNELTHVRFHWNGEPGVVHWNRNEFKKLTPALRYFVLMHELGHLFTMPLFVKNATEFDEQQADNYALEECRKAGYFFESTAEARRQYHQLV